MIGRLTRWLRRNIPDASDLAYLGCTAIVIVSGIALACIPVAVLVWIVLQW